MTALVSALDHDAEWLQEAYKIARNPRLGEWHRRRILRELETQHLEALRLLACAGERLAETTVFLNDLHDKTSALENHTGLAGP